MTARVPSGFNIYTPRLNTDNQVWTHTLPEHTLSGSNTHTAQNTQSGLNIHTACPLLCLWTYTLPVLCCVYEHTHCLSFAVFMNIHTACPLLCLWTYTLPVLCWVLPSGSHAAMTSECCAHGCWHPTHKMWLHDLIYCHTSGTYKITHTVTVRKQQNEQKLN